MLSYDNSFDFFESEMLIKIVPRPLRWPGVRWPPPFRFCQKRMLIKIGL
jgi:hypothetical protein